MTVAAVFTVNESRSSLVVGPRLVTRALAAARRRLAQRV